MEYKTKICKGINLAKGYDACGLDKRIVYGGLCSSCLYDWMNTTENGKIYKDKFDIKVKAKIKSNRNQKKREIDTKGAMRLADMYFSRYIRVKHSDFGKCTCYTCGIIKDIKEVDNGHYIKREHKATRFHKNNGRPQCKICNGDTKHNGKQAEFRVNLVNEIGEDEVSKLELLSRTKINASNKFYRDTADYYRTKLNELQKKLKVKYW